MGLRRRIIKGLLRKYVHNLQDRHIHVDVRRGCIRVDDVLLDLAPLTELLEGVLPAGCEVTQARAIDIRLDVPWKQLRQRSTTLTIGEVSIAVTQHPCAACGLSAAACQHWAEALQRRRAALCEQHAAAKRGPASIQTGSLVSSIAGGLQVIIDALSLSLVFCTHRDDVPHATFQLHDLFVGPVNQRLSQLTSFSASEALAFTSKDVRIGAVSLKLSSKGSLRRLLHPTALSCRLWWYMPSDGHVACPFTSSTRVELELQALCIDGDEEQMQALLKTLVEITDAEQLLSQRLGPLPWTDAEHDALVGAGDKILAEVPLEGTSSERSDASSSLATESALAENGSGSKKSSGRSLFRRLLPGKKSKSDATKKKEDLPVVDDVDRDDFHLKARAIRSGTTSAEKLSELPAFEACDEDDSDDAGLDEEDTTLSSCDGDAAVACDDLDFQTPVAANEDTAGEQAAHCMREAAVEIADDVRPTWDVGNVRQRNLTLQLSTARICIALPGQGRADFSFAGLGYRQLHRAWLTDAQQACAALLGGRFSNAVAKPAAERGSKSVDGVIFAEHQLSLQTCSCTFSSDLAGEGIDSMKQQQTEPPESLTGTPAVCTAEPSVLLQPISKRVEMLSAKWQSACGEPCGGGRSSLCVWPMEVVVQSARVLYLQQVFQRLKKIFEPLKEGIEWSPEQMVLSSRARAARQAKTVVLRDVIVSQPALGAATPASATAAVPVPGEQLPHQVRIESLVLENVSPDLQEITSVFGLAVGHDDHASPIGMDPEEMDEEQLRAEVRMWRMKNTR